MFTRAAGRRRCGTRTSTSRGPGANEALVKIEVSGVNFIDVQYRAGKYKPPSLPFVDGMEASGTVAEIGPAVTGLAPGDRVAYTMVLGTYAEYQVVPAARLVPLPAHVDFRSAAAVMLQGTTAHYLTHSTFPLGPGHTALVHAGAGGVGQLIIQVARKCGARVIATAGTEAKAALARAAGAERRDRLHPAGLRSRDQASDRWAGVDVVYDSVGKDTFDKSLNCLRPRGCLALFGFSSGPVAPFDPAVLGAKGSLFLTRPGLNQYIATRDELLGRTRDLFAWIGAGELTLNVGATYPLSEAATAHTELEARRTTGKLLLQVGVS